MAQRRWSWQNFGRKRSISLKVRRLADGHSWGQHVSRRRCHLFYQGCKKGPLQATAAQRKQNSQFFCRTTAGRLEYQSVNSQDARVAQSCSTPAVVTTFYHSTFFYYNTIQGKTMEQQPLHETTAIGRGLKKGAYPITIGGKRPPFSFKRRTCGGIQLHRISFCFTERAGSQSGTVEVGVCACMQCSIPRWTFSLLRS